MGLLAYLVLFWALSYLWHAHLQPPLRKRRYRLKLLAAGLRERVMWDRDVLSAETCDDLLATAAEADRLRHDPAAAAPALDAFLTRAATKNASRPGSNRAAMGREVMELLIVVFGVVMGIRALFFQPFKIPTGSMQPTLYGIHFVARDEARTPGRLRRVLDYINHGTRAVEVVATRDGALPVTMDGQVWPEAAGSLAFGLLPWTEVSVGGRAYRFPGEPGTVSRYLREEYLRHHAGSEFPVVAAGDVLARGEVQLGDHLFVDRVSYNFAEPRRGDIVVFVTTGLSHGNQPLNGHFYIKRLVGLPGDTLRLADRKLHLRQPDGSWQVVDGSMDPAFERMYSFTGGYRGYWLPPAESAPYLNARTDTITLGPDEYFMMGDNSENSLDSRYVGPVPRRNIIGRALLVWWPFNHRWPWADRAPPEPFPSPPMRPDAGGF